LEPNLLSTCFPSYLKGELNGELSGSGRDGTAVAVEQVRIGGAEYMMLQRKWNPNLLSSDLRADFYEFFRENL